MFDLYGTLIDIHTEEDDLAFWTKFSNKTIKYKRYTPKKLKSLYKELCRKLSLEKDEIEILDVFKSLYDVSDEDALSIARTFRRLSTKYECLYKGVIIMLKELRRRGYNLYVLSNAQTAFTVYELKKLGIYDLFDQIAISSNYGYKKPSLEFYKGAMSDFGIEACDTMMIGNDYECDILPAKSLGLKTIFLDTNITPEYHEKRDVLGFDRKQILKLVDELFE